MYPPAHDQPRYSADVYQGPILVSGVPNPKPIHPYAPPMAMWPVPVVARKWSTGLCRCFDNPANSCFMSGTVYALLMGSACLYSCCYRSKLRGQYDLEEAPCADCLVHCCCETCALCQEYRELKNRGFDMGIGWEANMVRQQRGSTVAPSVPPDMTR